MKIKTDFSNVNDSLKNILTALKPTLKNETNSLSLSLSNINYNLSEFKYDAELGLEKSGYRLITNNGKEAGQEVPHFHIHILSGKNLKELK